MLLQEDHVRTILLSTRQSLRLRVRPLNNVQNLAVVDVITFLNSISVSECSEFHCRSDHVYKEAAHTFHLHPLCTGEEYLGAASKSTSGTQSLLRRLERAFGGYAAILVAMQIVRLHHYWAGVDFRCSATRSSTGTHRFLQRGVSCL